MTELDTIAELRRSLQARAERTARLEADRAETLRRGGELARAMFWRAFRRAARGARGFVTRSFQLVRLASRGFLLLLRAARRKAMSLRAGGPRRAEEHATARTVDATEALVLEPMDRDKELEALDRRQLMVRTQRLGPDHPDVALAARIVAAGHVKNGRYFHALELYERARSITARTYGPGHPEVSAIEAEMVELRSKLQSPRVTEI